MPKANRNNPSRLRSWKTLKRKKLKKGNSNQETPEGSNTKEYFE
jgi:hypothetical protein